MNKKNKRKKGKTKRKYIIIRENGSPLEFEGKKKAEIDFSHLYQDYLSVSFSLYETTDNKYVLEEIWTKEDRKKLQIEKRIYAWIYNNKKELEKRIWSNMVYLLFLKARIIPSNTPPPYPQNLQNLSFYSF